MLKRFLNKFLTYYVYRDWNIAIADISEDLDPVNVKWMKHNYRDRWFADPFVISETDDCYIVLVEECMHASGRGRIARLHVTKDTCELVKNETILDLPTHLSFPNFVINQTTTYLYPENASAGNTRYYRYGDVLDCCGIMTDEPLADAVMVEHQNEYYILATKGGDCNGSAFMGAEVDGNSDKNSYPKVAPGLCIGALKGMELFKYILEKYRNLDFWGSDGTFNKYTMIPLVTDLLISEGLKADSDIQNVGGLTVYPSEYFNPLEISTGRLKITPNTRSIHWFMASWLPSQPLWKKKLKQYARRLIKIFK